MLDHWGDFVIQTTRARGPLVVGIDPVPTDVPNSWVADPNSASWLRPYLEFLLDTVVSHVGFVKFQSAFFEAYGPAGLAELAHAIALAKRLRLGVILDAKRGDIGSTADAYARAYLTPASGAGDRSSLEVDCMTINPFLGPDTVEPFVSCAQRYGKGLFILAKTSNPGSAWIQDRPAPDETISIQVGRQIATWAQTAVGRSGWSAVGAVVAATFPEQGAQLRHTMPISIFLAPGIGPQGGSPQAVASLYGKSEKAVLVPVSRGITKTNSPHLSPDDYAAVIVDRIQVLKRSLL